MQEQERTRASASVSSFKPEVLVDGAWSSNSLVFATREEAESYARDLYSRWTMACGYRAVESSEPVNYRLLTNGSIERVELSEPS